MRKNISDSILSRLRSLAKKDNIAFQQVLNLFFQEEFIRRVAQSKYADQLILKGGFLLYLISDFTTRPTVDSDYLLKNHSNDANAVTDMIQTILEAKTSKESFEIVIRSIENINEMNQYSGIRVNLLGCIGKTRTPFSVDLGFGDIVIPTIVKRTLPVLLDGFSEPTVLTYSLESTISEKLDAMVRFMEFSGRMKDYYDVYYLAKSFDFYGCDLQEAISKTFSNRKTTYEKDTVQKIKRLIENEDVQKRWNVFCKKVLAFELSFEEVVLLIIDFLDPPFQAIFNREIMVINWNHKSKLYEQNEYGKAK